jgi:Rod binding domain-containing protein
MITAATPVALSAARAPDGATPADPKMVEAARQFEAIFLRQLLSGLEKAGELGGGSVTSGSGIYGSMMVGALAESAASGGGIGLSEHVHRALTPPPTKQP